MRENNDLVDDEITLRDTVLLVKDYVSYLLKKAVWIILAALILAAVFFYRVWSKPDAYNADLTFMINEEKGSSAPGLGSVLGQLGLGMGGGGGDNNLNKIVELSKSRRLVKNVLFDSILIDQKSDMVANHIISLYDYDADWAEEEEPTLLGFRFAHGDVAAFSRQDNEVLKRLHGHVIGNANNLSGLLAINYEDDTGILTITGRTLKENLSIELSRILYDQLSVFYVKKSTERQQATLNRLVELTDSVYLELNKVEYSLARYRDRSQQIFQKSNLVAENDLMRRQQVLNVMYAEALKNKETSAFMLSNATPFFQVIDLPIGPIYKNKKSVIKSIVIGGVLGGVLCAFLFVVARIYQSIMKQS